MLDELMEEATVRPRRGLRLRQQRRAAVDRAGQRTVGDHRRRAG